MVERPCEQQLIKVVFPCGAPHLEVPTRSTLHSRMIMPQSPARRPVVYLIAQPTVSRTKKPPVLDDLYNHGDVQVVCPTGDSPTFKPRECLAAMEQRLEQFDPDVDFLVWAGGDTLAAVFAGLLLAEREVYEFTWLRYERRRLEDGTRTDDGAKYVPVRINLCDPGDDNEAPFAPAWAPTSYGHNRRRTG